MRKFRHLVPLLLSLIGPTLLADQPTLAASSWTPLLDPTLSKWELWMGAPHESVTGLPAGTPTSSNGHDGVALGLNHDPKKVFSVIIENGQPVLKITGEIFGGLTTLADYENYHFSCQVKWGEKIWPPKIGVQRDSGLLYHANGPHGAFWNVWKQCVEFQVQEKDMGDLFMLAGTGGDVRVRPLPVVGQYDPKGAWDPAFPVQPLGRVQRSANYESPHGGWTTLEIYAVGQRSLHLVNGHVVMAIERIRHQVKKGDPDQVPLTKGQIQIQSEGAEVYYRDVKIQPITAFPDSLAREVHFAP